jgi:hypothetical protein
MTSVALKNNDNHNDRLWGQETKIKLITLTDSNRGLGTADRVYLI